MEFIFSLDSIFETAGQFWNEAGDASVFAFHGEMGAGKTTFIHALCQSKGVKDVTGSPTFSLINEYAYDDGSAMRKIYHMDLYRLGSEAEAMQAGVEECLWSGDLCLVEWPERAPGIFPEKTVHVYIRLADSINRELQIKRN